MKILYNSSQVKKKIAEMFSTSKGRRIAITAFVGNGAEVYLSKPNGIELICWPKAGGTNPNVLWELQRRGVKVFFADSLHMKVYWTADKGVVIASANLSMSALGAGGLKEIGIWMPSAQVDIHRILKSIDFHPAKDSELQKLSAAHKQYTKHNHGAFATKSKPLTFAQWYEIGNPGWRLVEIWAETATLSSASKALLMKEHGSTSCHDFIECDAAWYRKNDWLLYYRVNSKKGGPIGWFFAHHIVPAPHGKSQQKNSEDQILQVAPLGMYDTPPFKIDAPFRKAFAKAASQLGGMKSVIRSNTAKPSAKLLKLIYDNYK